MSWILLRGLTREARHWGTFVSQFEAQLAPAQVIALDLPGNGQFYQHTSPLNVHGMVTFARQQLLTQDIRPPYHLMAMSLGAMVAIDWAQRYPQEIERLVLINTSMRPFSTITQRLRPHNWMALLALAARWNDMDYTERCIHRLTCNQLDQRTADLKAWHQIRRSAPVSSVNALRQLAAASRFACVVQTPRCPVLVLSSDADRLVNPQCSTLLAVAWQATHHSHPWAGHDLPHDDARWVCEHVADWLLLLNL